MSETIRGIPVEHFPLLDSTSRRARRLVESGLAGNGPRIIVAGEQSGGVGRMQRAWLSPPGGLWMTLIWPREAAVMPIDALGLRVGLACLETIDGVLERAGAAPESAALKWPNDVLIGGRKVLGVLTESIGEFQRRPGVLLIGVGINANFSADQLPAGLATPATTLREHLGGDTDLDGLLEELVGDLVSVFREPPPLANVISAAEHRLCARGEQVRLTRHDGRGDTGLLLGLSPNGYPLIKLPDGQTIACGDIDSLRPVEARSAEVKIAVSTLPPPQPQTTRPETP